MKLKTGDTEWTQDRGNVPNFHVECNKTWIIYSGNTNKTKSYAPGTSYVPYLTFYKLDSQRFQTFWGFRMYSRSSLADGAHPAVISYCCYGSHCFRFSVICHYVVCCLFSKKEQEISKNEQERAKHFDAWMMPSGLPYLWWWVHILSVSSIELSLSQGHIYIPSSLILYFLHYITHLLAY